MTPVRRPPSPWARSAAALALAGTCADAQAPAAAQIELSSDISCRRPRWYRDLARALAQELSRRTSGQVRVTFFAGGSTFGNPARRLRPGGGGRDGHCLRLRGVPAGRSAQARIIDDRHGADRHAGTPRRPQAMSVTPPHLVVGARRIAKSSSAAKKVTRLALVGANRLCARSSQSRYQPWSAAQNSMSLSSIGAARGCASAQVPPGRGRRRARHGEAGRRTGVMGISPVTLRIRGREGGCL